jgi:hypothetical protein
VNDDDRLVSRLLAGRDAISRVEKDEVLGRVLAERPRRPRWAWLALPAVAAAAVAMLFIARPSQEPELAARGGSGAFAALHVTCSPACAAGGKLVIDLHGTTGYRYFAAFAKRADGTVLWYVPASDDATSVEVPAGGVLDRTVVLGPEHPAGTYRIYGVFSNAPLPRAAIREAFDPARMTAGAGTAVVAQEIVVR